MIILATFNVFLTLAACELVLRVAEQYSKSARRVLYMREDATNIGYENIANLRELVEAAPMSLPPRFRIAGYTLNSNGLRTHEYRTGKEPGVKRIVIVGDSFFYQNCGVPDEYHVATLLGRMLSGLGKTEIINLAITGTGPRFYARMIELEASRLDPDLIVVGFFVGNDLTDEPENIGWFPAEVRRMAQWRILRFARNVWTLAKWRAWASRNSWPPPPLGTPEMYEAMETGKAFIFQEAWPEWLTEHWAHLREYLHRIKRSADESRCPVLMVIIPDEMQVSPKVREYVAKGRQKEKLDFEKPNRMWTGLCRNEGIAVLDLSPLFRAAESRGIPMYYPNEGHWGIEGQQVAAEAIAREAGKLLKYQRRRNSQPQ